MSEFAKGLKEALAIAESVARAEAKSTGRRMSRGWEARVIAVHIRDRIERAAKMRGDP